MDNSSLAHSKWNCKYHIVFASRKRNKMFKKIMEQVSRNSIPIRPGRQTPRKISMASGKYKSNHKRCL